MIAGKGEASGLCAQWGIGRKTAVDNVLTHCKDMWSKHNLPTRQVDDVSVQLMIMVDPEFYKDKAKEEVLWCNIALGQHDMPILHCSVFCRRFDGEWKICVELFVWLEHLTDCDSMT